MRASNVEPMNRGKQCLPRLDEGPSILCGELLELDWDLNGYVLD